MSLISCLRLISIAIFKYFILKEAKLLYLWGLAIVFVYIIPLLKLLKR
jgi:hypothetical protein